MVRLMRSWLKLMALSLIGKPPGVCELAGPAAADCASAAGWRKKTQARTAIFVIAISITILSARVNSEVKEEAVELWLGGDVNLGDGGHGQLQGIAGIVQGR